MDRAKLLAVAFLAGTFSLGATVGLAWERIAPAIGGRPSLAVASRSEYDAFAREVGLTAAQRAAVDSILDARHRTIDSLLAPIRPAMAQARASARREIAARLSPEQRERFAAYLARRDAIERAAAARATER